MRIRLTLLTVFALAWTPLAGLSQVINYKGGEGPGAGKHLVLLASDHEYRAEETIPALAQILSKHHGFDCSIVFGVDENGHIKAGSGHIPGIEVLDEADGFVVFARFLGPVDEQMKHIDAYFNRGGPVVGLRTSTHGFKFDGTKSSYAKYDFGYKGEDYVGGFGQQVLGQSWVGHYGQNHKQSTLIEFIGEKAAHPILRGVVRPHVQAGGYNAEPGDDWDILTMAQPLMSMEIDGEPDASKPPMASEWTRSYKGKDGNEGRVFTSLYGASEDILNDDYRRLVINGIYWSVGLEEKIVGDSNIAFVGEYKPTTFRNGGEVGGIKPDAYQAIDSAIPAPGIAPPPRKEKKPKEAEAKKKQ